MSWNIGDDRNFFLKLKSKIGLHHAVLTTPKTSPEKLTLTVIEMQKMSDLEKIDSKEEKSRPKWTIPMLEEKYVWTSRLIQTNWMLSGTVTETV